MAKTKANDGPNYSKKYTRLVELILELIQSVEATEVTRYNKEFKKIKRRIKKSPLIAGFYLYPVIHKLKYEAIFWNSSQEMKIQEIINKILQIIPFPPP